jgi:hypothetical protein
MFPKQGKTESSIARAATRPLSNAWIYWILATAIGHVAGVSAFGILVLFVDLGAASGGSLLDTVVFAVLGLLDGLLVGVAQGLVLQYFTGQKLLGEWVLFTALGGIAAWVLGPIMGALAVPIVDFLVYMVAGGVAGALFGFSQRPTVQRRLDPGTGWVPANLVAGALAVTFAVFFSSLWTGTAGAGTIEVQAILLTVGVGGLIYGAVTARTVALMLDAYRTQSELGDSLPGEDLSKIPVR